MKKIVALMMALMMLLAGCAMAEELPFEPVWIEFEEGFTFGVPSDWLEVEVTEELAATGIGYAVCNPEATGTVMIGWNALEGEATIEDLVAAFTEQYGYAEATEINGIAFVGCLDEANDVMIFSCFDGAEPGVYSFYIAPASDEAFLDTACWILATLGNIE